jgi:copper resistance protein D
MSERLVIAVRFALYADLMALFGLAAFALYGLKEYNGRMFGRLIRPVLAGAAVLGLIFSALGLLVVTAGMSGVSPAEVDSASVDAVLFGTTVGAACLVRIGALALTMILIAISRSSVTGVIATLTSGAALATLVWGGHGVMDEGVVGWVHVSADILHLLASAGWLGALFGLGLLLFSARSDFTHLRLTYRALAGFSAAGTIFVAVIILTGLLNGWLLVGPSNLGALFTTLYGRLLLAKVALFGVMLGLASANRFRLTPSFEQNIEAGTPLAARRALRLSLATETAGAIAILAAVAWLGTLSPPISDM